MTSVNLHIQLLWESNCWKNQKDRLGRWAHSVNLHCPIVQPTVSVRHSKFNWIRMNLMSLNKIGILKLKTCEMVCSCINEWLWINLKESKVSIRKLKRKTKNHQSQNSVRGSVSLPLSAALRSLIGRKAAFFTACNESIGLAKIVYKSGKQLQTNQEVFRKCDLASHLSSMPTRLPKVLFSERRTLSNAISLSCIEFA